MADRKGYTSADYQRRADAGMTIAEAARDMGVAYGTVRQQARMHRMKFAQGRTKPIYGGKSEGPRSPSEVPHNAAVAGPLGPMSDARKIDLPRPALTERGFYEPGALLRFLAAAQKAKHSPADIAAHLCVPLDELTFWMRPERMARLKAKAALDG